MKQQLPPLQKRDPLKVLFAITVMPVGGAETLLANLVRRLDRARFTPELCCLKSLGSLGDALAREVPVHHGLIAPRCKYDVRVLPRLIRLMRRRQVDAVVTVGAGDTMFWTRLAAWWARVPVVLSALHSTGWPDVVGRLNHLLTPLTDGFIAVAREHGRYLVEEERFPRHKVRVIPNGVDVDRFRPSSSARTRVRRELGISNDVPLCGIVAALRPEKNHELFLAAAALVGQQWPDAQFLIVGDGAERERLQQVARAAGLGDSVHFLGNRSDVPDLLAALDVFSLTSHNEANPVSILEAMACGLPVVSTRVGSVAESVADGVSGQLVSPGDVRALARHWSRLFSDREAARQMGIAGRRIVAQRWSLDAMVDGYQDLATSSPAKLPYPKPAVAFTQTASSRRKRFVTAASPAGTEAAVESVKRAIFQV